jgi:multicomponent K+:H+ antiporter subunit D
MTWPHLVVMPVVLPLLSGAVLLLVERRRPRLAQRLSLAGNAALIAIAVQLMLQADRSGVVTTYLLGNWPAPFGVALALDRLSALMLLLAALVGGAALLYACGGDDRRGRHFHSLFQFQLMGLNGAFLTADLFNLFVFFELLLIASYGLLLHGAGVARLRASIHYVGFNLAGSSLFLIAVSLLYGLTGTLNMADLALRMAQLGADRALLVQTAALLLVVVFGVKAALLPLYFWLPATYGAASAPVAALFAIMTKVGVYSILRLNTLVFGSDGGAAAHVTSPWLQTLALATLLFGAVGALAARQLRQTIGNVVVASAGTLLLAVALGRADTVAAGLFYLVNSTLVVCALFLLADRIRGARGAAGDTLQSAAFGPARVPLGVLFFFLAVAAAGAPPLAGFLGKAMLLQSAGGTRWGPAVVAVVLASGLMMMVAFARSGSVLFWRPAEASGGDVTASIGPRGFDADAPVARHGLHGVSLALLAALIAGCAVLAGPLSRFTAATAQQLFARTPYLESVLGARAVAPAFDVRREMRERKAAAGAADDAASRRADKR